MKKTLFITVLIIALTATYGFAGMDDYMRGKGRMGGMMGQEYEDDDRYEYSRNMGPGMMGYGGYGMMGPGMMGGHMGGYGMMGQGHMGGMMGPGMMRGYGSRGYSAEEYERYQKEYRKYLDDTVELRRKLHNKRFDYYEALRSPDTKRKTLLKLEKEMMDLQWKLYEKAPE